LQDIYKSYFFNDSKVITRTFLSGWHILVVMKTEIEVKILDINVEAIKAKLAELGAKKVADRNMRRFVYDCSRERSFVRLRDDGEKSILTFKERKTYEIDSTKEIEVVVDNFEKSHELLLSLGLSLVAYQENKRSSYVLDGVEVEIDFWPKIPAYLEVEGKSIEEVEKIVKLLGFTMDQTTAVSTNKVYAKYGIDLHSFKELKFD